MKNCNQRSTLFFCFFFIVLSLSTHWNLNAQPAINNKKQFIPGGQFKDLIMPMPIYDEMESKNIWGHNNVIPRDIHNGIEDSTWCYWGGNPVKGKDGKYHIAICRWKENTGHWGWPESEVAHCISDTPTGPYSVTKTVLQKGHNPEVIRLKDNNYILHISGGLIYTSGEITGPWNLQGKIKIDTRGHKALSHLYTNLTGVERKDGSILFFTKRGDVMISNSGLLGPYQMVTAHNYSRYSGYPEDPVIWKSRHQYHVIYNHAVDRKSVYMRSLDGMHWITEPGLPYDSTIFRYTDGTRNIWYKYERPKVIQDNLGRATHLSLAVIDVKKREDLGNDKHSSKHVIMPLTKEKLITVLNKETITTNTSEVRIKLESEQDFSPADELNIESIRLGSSNLVNYGMGEKVKKHKRDGNNLILSFSCNKLGISNEDYDIKLLGETKSGKIIYGYALLPGKKEDPAALVTSPIQIDLVNDQKLLQTVVENFGLSPSNPSVLKIFQVSPGNREEIKVSRVPSLQPYEKMELQVPIKSGSSTEVEYEAVLVQSESAPGFWKKIDDTNTRITYKGNWSSNEEAGKDIYLGSENICDHSGASAVFTFKGTQARCYGRISKEMGSIDVYLNDKFVERVDCYFGAEIHNTVIYQTGILPKGEHKLELRLTGEHYKNTGKGIIALDAFAYR